MPSSDFFCDFCKKNKRLPLKRYLVFINVFDNILSSCIVCLQCYETIKRIAYNKQPTDLKQTTFKTIDIEK